MIDDFAQYKEEELKDITDNYGTSGFWQDYYNNGIPKHNLKHKQNKEPPQWDAKVFRDKLRNPNPQQYINTKKFPMNLQRQASDIEWNLIDTLINNDNSAISDDDLIAMENVVSQGSELFTISLIT